MPELIPITLFVCIAAVMILRPITKRMGGLLDAMTRERVQTTGHRTDERRLDQDRVDDRMISLIEHVSRRLDLIEERLDFNERLLSKRDVRDVRVVEPVGQIPRS